MILGLVLPLGAFDAERGKILAQPRQRPLVEEAGEIIGAVGQQLAAPDADEQIEKFALDLLGVGRARGLRQSGVRHAERRRVAAQLGDAREQAPRPASAPAAPRAAHIPARARHRLRRTAAVSVIEVGPQNSARRPRSPPRPTSTRSAGTCDQLETEGWEMPIRRASSVTPPAARIASEVPVSAHRQADQK